MKLSFIIVNYRSREYLNICLASIFKKINNIDFEIIVVNNDEEKLFLNEYKKPILVVEINKNIGFSKANNIGVKESKGEIICFLNPDTEIISGEIIKLCNIFKEDKKVSIIGAGIQKENKIQPWSVGVDMNLKEIIRGKFGFAKSKNFWKSLNNIEAEWVSGAGMFVKRDDFLKVGGFDENFFLYYEDVDLCKRIGLLNKKIIYAPFFKINHLEGKSSNKKYDQKVYYFKSQDYFFKKWFSPLSLFILKFFRFFYIIKLKLNSVDIFFFSKTKKYPENNNSRM